ncbi:MAG: hypothetical protein JNM43_08670 [Planctomycetaceae bacterium]|nr:hypothetical protein [Planctomycetaceae bacterium]
MTNQCSSTANSITEVLLAGDAVLNLTQQPLNTIAGTRFVSAEGDVLLTNTAAAMVLWKHSMTPSLSRLVSGAVSRLVVVSEEDCSDASMIVRELEIKGIPHLHCTLMSTCDADAFMDEEDAEAVTERLRQLGYI